MRIISQDGEFDLPYEEATIQFFLDGKVVAYSLSDLGSNDFITMAKYSTKEKAIKAMKMCRNEYLYLETYGSNMFPFEAPKVFQFPADSEV